MGDKQPVPGESHLFKLAVQARADSERWFGDQDASHSLPHMVLALCGEAGELANIIKKVERGSLDIKEAAVRHQINMEVTDVFVYLLNISGLILLDLELSNQVVRAQNEKRFMAERQKREGKVNGTGQ
jgi:NTP pyrophosphatase (non-canonical NTP hydrolase)